VAALSLAEVVHEPRVEHAGESHPDRDESAPDNRDREPLAADEQPESGRKGEKRPAEHGVTSEHVGQPTEERQGQCRCREHAAEQHPRQLRRQFPVLC
jgi:hypothetical protein